MMSDLHQKYFQKILNKDGTIAALAIDQQGAMKKMISEYKKKPLRKIS